MTRVLKIGLISFLVLYVIPLVLLYVFQRSFLYIPPKQYIPPSAFKMEQVKEVRQENSDGEILTGWWLLPKSETAPVVLFFHGNGSAVFSNHDIYADLNSKGYGVFGVGYPGYPGSSGKPTQSGIVAAAQTQHDWVMAQGIAPERIVFYGTSLGSGVAAQLSKSRKPALLILEAPFTSTIDMGRMSMPIFPVKSLMKDTFESDVAISDLDIPLLWLHGTKDEVVPFAMGQTLYNGYEGPKKDLVVEDGRHTNLWGLGGREFIFDALVTLSSQESRP